MFQQIKKNFFLNETIHFILNIIIFLLFKKLHNEVKNLFIEN